MTAKAKAGSKPNTETQVAVKSRRKRRNQAERRTDLREELWPRSSSEIWSRHGNDGYATIPRLLPLIAVLIRDVAKTVGTGDPTSVYFELWARVFDEGLVQIRDEHDCAFASGYSGPRALRTWRERMGMLEDLGFIKVQPAGNRQFAHILIVNPLVAVARLKKSKTHKIRSEWWSAYIARADEVGANIAVTA